MDVVQALGARKSVRAFKKDPVPEALIREIFEQAALAPSNCNTQPWRVDLVSGDSRDRLEQRLVAAAMSGKPGEPEFQGGVIGIEGIYKTRQWDCAMALYGMLGIEREDKMARNIQMLQNFRFFGAPHGAFLSMSHKFGPVNAVDVGIYLQSLMLLMASNGLASCAQGALAFYPQQVREVVDLPEDYGILCGLSFGYADEDAVVNQVTTDRVPLQDNVHFYP